MIPTNHMGRKIARLRELREIKQDAFAKALGINLHGVALIESSEDIDDAQLKLVAKVLGLSGHAIRNFADQSSINFINNFYDHSSNQGPMGNYNNCTYNPIDTVVALYERMLAAEKEKTAYLEKLLKE